MPIGEMLRRNFIPVIDRTAPLRGPLADAGGLLRLGAFPQADVELYLAKLAGAARYRLDRAEIRELMRKLTGYGVPQLLTDYLGRFWSADYAAIWRSPGQSSSGQWHHDNVGNRVKLFVVLANDAAENGTEFVPNTHTARWQVFSGRPTAPAAGGEFVSQQRGDVLIFDTNVLHRGKYSPRERIVMQMEFSNILKSFVVFGQCGRFFRARFERGYGAGE